MQLILLTVPALVQGPGGRGEHRGGAALVQARAGHLGHRGAPCSGWVPGGWSSWDGRESLPAVPGAWPSARAAAAASQENEPGARCHWAISPYSPAVNSRAASAGSVPAGHSPAATPAAIRLSTCS